MWCSNQPTPSIFLVCTLICFTVCGLPMTSYGQDSSSSPVPVTTTETTTTPGRTTETKTVTPTGDSKINVQLNTPAGNSDRSSESTSKQTNSSVERQSVVPATQTTTPDNTTTALLISGLVVLGILGVWGVSKLQQPK